MATFPAKTNYAAGNVLTAAQMVDIGDQLNVLNNTSAGKNPIINGGSDIWQRGTSIAIPSSAWTYANDRFYYYRGATGLTVSRQATSDSTNLPFIQYCTRVQRDSGNTSTVSIYQYHDIETANSIPFAGKQITVSFYARRGANWSVSGNTLPFQLITGTGTDQNLRGGYTGAATLINTSFTLTTTWQRFSATATVSATATQIGFQFPNITPTGTAGAADFYEITGFQIDAGALPTAFARAGGTIQGELAACQRYYERTVTTTNNISFPAFCNSTTIGYVNWNFKVQKRSAPSMAISNAGHWAIRIAADTNCAATNHGLIGNTVENAWFSFTTTGLTAGQGAFLVNLNNSAWLEASSEL